MTRRWISVLIIIISCLSAWAIQFTTPFKNLDAALKMIKEKSLSQHEALYYRQLSAGAVQCQLCPNRCTLANLARGLCGVRVNLNGKLYSLVYGKPVAVHVDPIEKKPLSHFLPGTTAFSLATAGCNLGCSFCQNWQISQAKPEETEHYNFEPEKIITLALQAGSPTIAYTYTEPTIFYEYMLDTAKLAKKNGLRNVMHSCGYINPAPLKELLPYLDACNIDLKGFSEEYYQQLCNGSLAVVLENLKIIKKSGVWLEITNLVIPGKNDDSQMIRAMCDWIKTNLGPDVPLYFSAFHPQYKLTGLPPTPVATLEKAYQIGKDAGLHYVYIGNVFGQLRESTRCPRCGKIVIERVGYSLAQNNLKNGHCRFCDQRIAGVWR